MSNFNIINSSSFRFVLDGFHENDPGLIAVFAEIDPGSVYPSAGAFLFDDAVIIDGAGNNIVFNSSTAILSFIELDENGDVVGSVASGLSFEGVLGFLGLVPNENDEVMIDINDDMITALSEGAGEEIALPTYDEYIGSWNADVNLENSYAQLFNYYSNPEDVTIDGETQTLYGAMVLAHYFSAEMLEGSHIQLEAAEEAKEVPHEGWAGQELHENHMDLKQALNDALMSLGGGEGGMFVPEWTPSTYAAQWVVPDGYVLSDYNDYNAMPEGGLSLIDSDDDDIPDLWWLHHIATHADAMGLDGLVDQVNPGPMWMEAANKAMEIYQFTYPGTINENHEELLSALTDALGSGEGSGGLSQEDYGILWAESGDGNYWYAAWDDLEADDFPGDIPLNALQNMQAGLAYAWNSFDESIITSVPPSPTAHQSLMAATQDAIDAFASESSGPVTHTVNISNETLTLGPDLFTAQPIHDVMIIANSSEELTAIKLTLGDSWGDGWGATLRLSDPDNDQTVIYTHNGPPNVSGNGVGNSEDVEVNLTAAPLIEQGGQFARNVRFQLSPTGSFDNDVSVTIASLGSQDNQPVEDNTPYALFNIDLLNPSPSSNQYGGVPTVLGNDISISSAGDLLVAVDLQLGFSETGKQAILDEVVAYYGEHNSHPPATSGNPAFQDGIVRPIIDAFISEGHNLDLWFGLGEQDLSVYASDAGGNFPQDHHDALVRYGQSDGFNASPPPQSIWPSGAEYVDITGLLQNYFDFLVVAPTLEDGSPDFAQLDFSGKIVLPTLTYEIDPEQNNPGSGSAKVRLVAARNQNDAYALDYDVAQFPDGTPFLNPQYAAVDVQSVNFPLSNNNNENNDSQQGENNMSYNIQNSPDVENPLKQTITITGIDQTVLDSAPEVMLDWADQVYPNPIALNLNSTLGGLALGDDFTFQIQITIAEEESGGSDEYEIFIDGSSIGSGYMPSWTGSVDGNTGLQIDLMGDYNAPNGVFDTEHTTHTFQFAGEEADNPNANVDVPDGNTPSEGDAGDAAQNTLDIGNLGEACDFPRGPMARQLRFHKLIDESAVDFTIGSDGQREEGSKDFAGALEDQLAAEVAGTQTGTPVVSIQSELQVQSDRMLELERMLHGGVDLSDSGSSIVFDSRASMKLMAEELKGDQDAIQIALRLKDGATAFEDLDKYKINSLDMQDLDPRDSSNEIIASGDGTVDSPFVFVSDFGSSDFADLAAAIEAMRAKLERYDGDSDPLSGSNWSGLSDDQAKLDALIAVYNTLEQGVTVKLESDGSSSDISGTHFDASMDLEEALRKLDAGIIDADVAIAANDDDITDIRTLLGDSVIDDYVAFDTLHQHRVENESITGSDLPVVPDLETGAWPEGTDTAVLFSALTGYDPARHDDNDTTNPVDGFSDFGALSVADQKAHLDACRSAGVSGGVRRNAAGESDFFIAMADSAFDSSETVESALRKLDIDHAATEHEVGEAADLLGITLGSRDEAGEYTDGDGFVFATPSSGAGFLSGKTTVLEIADALNAEAQEASNERDNVVGQIGSALSDTDLSGKLPNSYTTIVAAINGEYTWRTEGINYKPSVADVAALDAAIIADATREKGDTYWVEGVKTRYTIAGFTNADGMASDDSEYDREIAIAEGADQAAVPGSDNQAVLDGLTWSAAETAGHITADQLADYVASDGAGDPTTVVVVEGALVAASAADTVFVSITQSVDMAKSDQQDMLDQLALEHYDMGVGGLRVLMHEPTAVVSSGALEDLLRSTGAYSGAGMNLGSVGYGEVLLNGLTVGWLMKIEGYTATEVVDAANPLNQFVPCSSIPVVFPHDQIVVKYSKDMDRAKEALLIAAEAGE